MGSTQSCSALGAYGHSKEQARLLLIAEESSRHLWKGGEAGGLRACWVGTLGLPFVFYNLYVVPA